MAQHCHDIKLRTEPKENTTQFQQCLPKCTLSLFTLAVRLETRAQWILCMFLQFSLQWSKSVALTFCNNEIKKKKKVFSFTTAPLLLFCLSFSYCKYNNSADADVSHWNPAIVNETLCPSHENEGFYNEKRVQGCFIEKYSKTEHESRTWIWEKYISENSQIGTSWFKRLVCEI